MRRLLVGFLIIALVGCGGSSGDDDEGTATSAGASSPTRAAASPTVAQRATSAASPSAQANTGGGATNAGPPKASPTVKATPTRIGTVVSTRRKLAPTPTAPVQNQPTPTIAPTADTSDFQVVFSDDFESGTTEMPTGEKSNGVVIGVEDGVYYYAVPDGQAYETAWGEGEDFADGYVDVTGMLQGDGTIGVVGRFMNSEDGSTASFFLCWMDSRGAAGCDADVLGEWTSLWSGEHAMDLTQPTELTMAVVGNSVTFLVNLEVKATAEFDGLPDAGTWGVYADSYSGDVLAGFDSIEIATGSGGAGSSGSTDEPPGEDAFDPIVGDQFDTAESVLPIGTSDFGVTTAVQDGIYLVSVPEESWQTVVPEGMDDLLDGQVAASLSLSGTGVAGVAARSLIDADGNYYTYICWISSDDTAGCSALNAGEWTTLWVSESGAVPTLEVNTIFMTVVGSTIWFEVNGELLAQVSDASIDIGGSWGLYVESISGTFDVAYDVFVISEYIGP